MSLYIIMDFKEFLIEQQTPEKLWKAKRDDILRFWQAIRPGAPLAIEPIDPTMHKGTKFRTDGLRITGSSAFINSVLSRVKDLLQYEDNPATKLEIEYRQIQTKEGDLFNKPVYVAYVHVLKNKEKPKIATIG